jgi:hypothetical protein
MGMFAMIVVMDVSIMVVLITILVVVNMLVIVQLASPSDIALPCRFLVILRHFCWHFTYELLFNIAAKMSYLLYESKVICYNLYVLLLANKIRKGKGDIAVIQHQPYDNALKSLMADHAAEIIPQFIPGAELVSEQNVEIKRELLRPDLVYLIKYKGKPHVLNLELQTASDRNMVHRVLLYHVELHIDYVLPVLSVILYLFETNVPTPPFREESEDEALLTLKYDVVTLWTHDAREYVQNGILHMYTFLPAMKGANAPLLLQAIKQMEQHYDRPQFVRHLIRLMRLLQRSTTMSELDKQLVKEELLTMYDSLIDENPDVQERVARSEARGEMKGELRGLRKMVLEAVKDTYPSLEELAQEHVQLIEQPDALRQLVRLIYKTSDEPNARWLLKNFAA